MPVVFDLGAGEAAFAKASALVETMADKTAESGHRTLV